ncbi:MAG: hypothetical protein E7364_06900 [Clostridiales bacterium]|nr:hypothetical protein [Clostridiales bacterium]
MKRMNKKLLTLMLAGALCSATLGGILAQDAVATVSTSAAEATKKITEVFEADKTAGGAIITKANNATADDKTETLAFELKDSDDKVSIKRDLAYKWFVGKNAARYFNMTFAFEALSFESVSFVMECAPSVATEDEKISNTVKFTQNGGKIYASVLNGDVEDTANKKEIALTAGQDVKVEFRGTADSDAFAIVLTVGATEYEIGEFTNIGANYADYSAEKISPLSVSAAFAEGATDTVAVVLMKDINGQSFTNITGEEGAKVVKDTAAPVLVVNEDLNGFMLGTKIYDSLKYVNVDVLQTSNISETKEFYRYNPVDTTVTYTSLKDTWATTLVNYTTYYVNDSTGEISKEAKDGFRLTSVYLEEGAEYVSTKITLGDDAFKDADGEWAKVVYDLSWYAPEYDPTDASRKIVVEKNGVDCIIVDRNTNGPSYKYITANHTTKENDVDEAALEAQAAIFQAKLEEKAKGVYAGGSTYMYFPSMEWLLEDNNGYRGLRFVISYKTPTSQSPSASSIKAYSSLSLTASSEGTYEFKIFASDKAGNPMYYYLDNELVEVTSSNVWDIKEIPSFTYEIENLGIKVESSSATNRKTSKILNETYTFVDPTIKGATNKKSAYALYKINLAAYNDTLTDGTKKLSSSMLAEVGYDQIAKKLEGKITVGADYFDLYTTAISEVLAEKVTGDATAIKAIFGTAIQEYNSKITEDDPEWEWNKYQWKPSSKSFKTVEEGTYMIIADYSERDLPMQRAAAYKVINVASEADIIKGETQWLKDNVISVVLFSIAGVMLVIIIILLLIKPTDETLEDLDKKPAKKSKKDKKKDKKSK